MIKNRVLYMILNLFIQYGGVMKRIHFEDVTVDSLWEVTKLSNTLTPNQKECVADNA